MRCSRSLSLSGPVLSSEDLEPGAVPRTILFCRISTSPVSLDRILHAPAKRLSSLEMASFNYLIRFTDIEGRIHFGEAGSVVQAPEELVGRAIKTYSGIPGCDDFSLTGKEAMFASLLCPLPSVPTIYGVGLNYKTHADEGSVGLDTPEMLVNSSDRYTPIAQITAISDDFHQTTR
jgi:hypothetical protein